MSRRLFFCVLTAFFILSPDCQAQLLGINAIASRAAGAASGVQTESTGGTSVTVNEMTGQVTTITPYGSFNVSYETNAGGYNARTTVSAFRVAESTTVNTSTSQTPLNSSFAAPEATGGIEAASPDEFEYNQALGLTYLFYGAQQSGVRNDTRIPWRSDSALSDVAPDGTPLVGGYYDAGDNLKLNFPAAFAFTMLTWSVLEFSQSYVNAAQLDNARNVIRHATDFFVTCHHADLAFTIQTGDPDVDHSFWIPPEQITESRPSYDITPESPGSDGLGAVVACLAAASELFGSEKEYHNSLLAHARDLYTFATNFPGKYSDGISKAYVYPSSGYIDELAFAAAWLYRATGESQFLVDAQKYHSMLSTVGTSFSWDDKSAGSALMLALLVENGQNSVYVSQVQQFLNAWSTGTSGVRITPGGLSFVSDWGSLRYAGNAAALAVLYANNAQEDPKAALYACWARKQIRYLLGSNGRSYMVGYGTTPPLRVHHRAASCPGQNETCGFSFYSATSPNPNVIFGAVVGGPHVDDSYDDSRQNFQTNEVALDYSAGIAVALSFLSGPGINGSDSWTTCQSSGVF